MRTCFPHYGTMIAESGAVAWFITILLAWLRTDAFPIPETWLAIGLTAGLLLILMGVGLEIRSRHRPLSPAGIAHLHWLARFCPFAKALAERKEPHPTWGEAFAIEEICHKHTRGR